MNKQTAKIMYDHYTKQIETLSKAIAALSDNSVSSYTIGDRSVTKMNLKTLDKELEDAVYYQSYYEALLKGRPVRRMVGIVPTDK